MYLDVMINDNDDCLLYINGKPYNDIDVDWAKCILWLKDITPDNIKITKRIFEGEYKNFLSIINYQSYDFRWRKILSTEIPDYISKTSLKCEINNAILVVEQGNKLPNYITTNDVIYGQWYALIK